MANIVTLATQGTIEVNENISEIDVKIRQAELNKTEIIKLTLIKDTLENRGYVDTHKFTEHPIRFMRSNIVMWY